jgi:hypothetical protein
MQNFISALCIFLSTRAMTHRPHQFNSVGVAITLSSANILSLLDLFLIFIFTVPNAAWNVLHMLCEIYSAALKYKIFL